MLPPHLLLTSVRLQGDNKVKETATLSKKATFLKVKKARSFFKEALPSFMRIILLPVAESLVTEKKLGP